MSRSAPTFLQRLSALYKTSRTPWKKHVLVGSDLEGNEFWESPNPLGGRVKRWVQMKNVDDYAVYQQDQLPVQWQAWLRHTRPSAPTLQELSMEVQKRALIQERAKNLEAEWQQRKLQLQEDKAKENSQPEPTLTKGSQDLQESKESKESKDSKDSKDPKESTGQGDTFVPGSWSPNSARQR